MTIYSLWASSVVIFFITRTKLVKLAAQAAGSTFGSAKPHTAFTKVVFKKSSYPLLLLDGVVYLWVLFTDWRKIWNVKKALLFCQKWAVALSCVHSVYNQHRVTLCRVTSLQQPGDTSVLSSDSMRCPNRQGTAPTTSIRQRQQRIRVTNSTHSADVREARKQVICSVIYYCVVSLNFLADCLSKILHPSSTLIQSVLN
jgi:hypothetical protein